MLAIGFSLFSLSASHKIWLVRFSPGGLGFSQSNLHYMSHGRLPIVLPWGLPAFHVLAQATQQPDPAFPVTPSPADLHRDTTKNCHPTITVHKEEPVSQPPIFEISLSVLPDSILHSFSHHKGTSSFNKPQCSSLNKIKVSKELFIKNFFFWTSPIFFACEPPNYNPLKKGT